MYVYLPRVDVVVVEYLGVWVNVHHLYFMQLLTVVHWNLREMEMSRLRAPPSAQSPAMNVSRDITWREMKFGLASMEEFGPEATLLAIVSLALQLYYSKRIITRNTKSLKFHCSDWLRNTWGHFQWFCGVWFHTVRINCLLHLQRRICTDGKGHQTMYREWPVEWRWTCLPRFETSFQYGQVLNLRIIGIQRWTVAS